MHKPVQSDLPILLVEDSPEDFEITLRVFKKINLENPVHRCSQGEEALDYLLRRGAYADPSTSPRPGIILLDLNLPGLDGRDVLAQVKNHPELKTIPIVVLTTSTDDRDIKHCYQHGANSYMQKPVTMPDIIAGAQRLKEYWFEMVLLPKLDA